MLDNNIENLVSIHCMQGTAPVVIYAIYIRIAYLIDIDMCLMPVLSSVFKSGTFIISSIIILS